MLPCISSPAWPLAWPAGAGPTAARPTPLPPPAEVILKDTCYFSLAIFITIYPAGGLGQLNQIFWQLDLLVVNRKGAENDGRQPPVIFRALPVDEQ